MPPLLLSLVAMLLYGPSIKTQSSSSSLPQSALTLSQLLMHDSLGRRTENSSTSRHTTRHSQDRETPLPIYLGVIIHMETRNLATVDDLFHLGLSISYDRALDISTELENKICHQYDMEQTVCPPQLKGSLTAAVENIDHNPSSTSAHDSFHGTGISLFQHPDSEVPGVDRVVAINPHITQKDAKINVAHLPETYTIVPPVALRRQDPPVPKLDGPKKADCQLIPQAMQKEYR